MVSPWGWNGFMNMERFGGCSAMLSLAFQQQLGWQHVSNDTAVCWLNCIISEVAIEAVRSNACFSSAHQGDRGRTITQVWGPTRAPGQPGLHWEFCVAPQKDLLLKINLIGCPTSQKSHLCNETCLLILKKRNRNKAEGKKDHHFTYEVCHPMWQRMALHTTASSLLEVMWSSECCGVVQKGLSPKNYSELSARELGSGSRLSNFLTALPVSFSTSGKTTTTTNCLTEEVSKGSLRWGRIERKIQSTTRLCTGQRGALDSVTHRFNHPAGLDFPAANLLPFCFAQMLEGWIYS